LVSVISGENTVQIINVPEGGLLAALRSAGVYLPAICGGRGTCGKCRIRVTAGSLPVSAADEACFSRAELDGGWRLACAAVPGGDITVRIPESGERQFAAVDRFAEGEAAGTLSGEAFEPQKSPRSFAAQLEDAGLAGSPPRGGQGRGLSLAELREAAKLAGPAPDGGFCVYRDRGGIIRVGGGSDSLYAVAVDIGTTTLGFALLDLRSGTIAGRFSAVNRQREFGGDVISRIERANGGDLFPLSRCVRKQITEGIAALCGESAVEARHVCKIAIAGNTTMLHLLLGLSCQTLGRTPFTPVTLDTVFLNFREIAESDVPLPAAPACETVILPGISTYVGADIAAGLLFAEPHQSGAPAAFMDIGTNGEMALAYQGKILCTATAAGPAFEGGNILWGTGSVPGAISRVSFRDGVFEASAIGGMPPIGICGSGVVDTVYQGLTHGYIQPSGRFTEKVREEGIVLARTGDGRDIVFCQKDVRELQLGKSAIRSGLDALLNYAGLAYDDIQALYIAGGFGFNLNMESAAGIGLIPEALLPKVSLVGNSALGGAVKYLLNPEHDETLRRIITRSEEFSLPEDRYFSAHFIDNVTFE
jgi:uncharacterized 2Fe-2S/4Fe-4S cluster protein (DUF4445 family)